MGANAKTWLIVAGVLILVGSILFVCVMTRLKWDFTKLSTAQLETNRYTFTEAVHEVRLQTETADILFVPSEGDTCEVVCYEETTAKHTVSVRDGVLTISNQANKKWYDFIGIHFAMPKLTVYLPAGAYGALAVDATTGDVEIPADFTWESIDVALTTGDVDCAASATGHVNVAITTGDIHLNGITVGDLALKCTTGDCELTDVTCQSLASTGSTGDLLLRRVIASGTLQIKRTTGDVALEACDAAELYLKTTTGDVTGSLCTEKDFFAKATTGSVQVPDTHTGGRCEIKTTTGDIHVTVGG